MNKMILRNQQELLCHCGNTRKAKPIRQAKARLLLILAALLFGGKAWGQVTYHHTVDWGVTGATTIDYNYIANTGYPFYNWVGYLAFFDNDPYHNGGWCNVKITLKDNVTINVPIIVAQGQTIDIETSGNYTITRGPNIGTGLSMFYIGGGYAQLSNAGTLTINETASKTITIDGGNIATTTYGSSFFVHPGCNLTCTKCTFTNGIAKDGGVIYNTGTLAASTCTFQNNAASGLGGGIFTTNSATLTSCTITGNTAGDGAGIYASNALTCTTCTITNNNTTNVTGVNKSGGGVYYCGSNTATAKATFTNGTINGNNAHYKGGGIIIHKNGTAYCELDMTGTTVYNNTAPNGGGIALHSTGVTFNMTSGEIYKNFATSDGTTIDGNGGGVHVSSGSTFNMSGGSIGKSGTGNPNQAMKGAGVYSVGTFSMTGGNIYYNSATDGAGLYVNDGTASITTGGSVNNNNASQDGGGVYVNGGTFTVSASREIIKNTATRNGGGVYVASGGTFNSNGLVGKSSNANTAERGAGVYTAGTLNIQGGNIQYNTMTGTAKLGAGVYIAGGTTTMSGGAINNHTTTVIDGAGVYINGGTFAMTGGEIYKNTATGNGGGVYVGSGSTFNYNGGVVGKASNLNQAANGGGVYNAGTFNMNANVSYNTATSNGGGIYVASGSTFTMGTGTEISNNTATVDGGGLYLASDFTLTADRAIHTNTATKNGGGVYVASGVTFTMTGGEIHANTSSNTALGTGGGGVYTEANSTFNMSGGEIYHNTANSGSNGSGGGVLSNGTFNMNGGDIGRGEATDNNANTSNRNIADYGGGVFINTGTFTMSGTAKIHGNRAVAGGGVYLYNGSFTMNNGEIHYNYATSRTRGYGGGGVYVAENCTFTMNDGVIFSNQVNVTSHTDSNNNSVADDNSGGGVCTSGTFNMAGGSIGKTESGTDYPNHTRLGGGVYVFTNGTFNMTGGEIVANTCANGGAGVYVYTGGTFTMDNATIHHNTSSSHGGGIYTLGSVTATDNNNNNNTKIYNNTASGTGADGGGVFVNTAGSFSMTNGEIFNNTCTDGGGGIFLVNQATSSASLINTNVYGNTANHGAGIYKNASAVLSITGGEFYSNAATTNGGAINSAGGTVTLTGVSIGKEDINAYLPNTAKVGGGIYMYAGTVTIQKNSSKTDTKSYIIGNNTISGGTTGGGIHMVKGTLNISDTEITGNTATTTGGGIHMADGTLNLSDIEISGNTATTNGGGIYHAAGTINITDSEIINNTATTTGGGIHKAGGNIYVSGVVVINNNLIGAATSNLHIANANTKFIYIAADGLECGSCIGITSAVGYSTNTKKIVQGDGTGTVPNDNCAYAYRNRFFFSDTGLDGIFNNNASPYYSGSSNSLYFVQNATYQAAMNSWLTSADATGCTLDGNGFVTAVNNAAGMAYFAQHILAGNDYSGKTVSLTADIDLSGHNWEPIGYAAECLEGNGTIFNGTFEGQGHTIANITSPFPYDNMGLFGVVGDDGVVKNTVVANINFTGTNTHTGAVAGLLNGSVYNCSAITQSGTGTTAASLVGEVGADGSLKNCFVNTSATNGLADMNGGTIENCYMRGTSSFVGGTGTGTVNYCYAPSGSVSGTNSVYGATNLPNGKYGFAHSDQQITSNSDNTHIVNGAIDNHGELKGLLATLNHWVKASGNGWNAGTQSNSNGYALWTRTMASPINGDYPVLMMPGTVCVGSPDGTILNYAADINTLLTTYSTSGDIYLYATNPTSLGGTSGTTRVYINEHVGVLQNPNTTLNARVGVTLDNSSTGYMSYDWHMFSSALTSAPLGLEYHSGVNDNYYVKTNYSTLLSSGIPHSIYTSVANMDPTKTTWSTANIGYFPTNTPYGTWRGTADPVGSFDFYCYYEPACHWLNFKREGTTSFFDHWCEPEDANHMHLNIPYENESTMTQGKGYMTALSEPSMLMADGVLNNGNSSGNVSVNVTATDVNLTGYEYALKGVNLIGNPYQSYLDFDEFNTENGINTYFILDADSHGYVSYTVGQSDPVAPAMLHPHQGFFVKVSSSGSLQFTPSMRATTGDNFRSDTPHYPLVNLICTDSQGRNDFATVELDRPEAGGGEKAIGLHAGDASLWIHTNDKDWQTAFTTSGLHEVPVRFKAYQDGLFTISWNTKNADFSYMHLIDNMTGVDVDCLNASEYHFEGKASDYTARFRLVFEYTGVDENGNDPLTGSETFAFMMGDELVVNGDGLLEMFDLNGRCLLSKEIHGEQSTLHLPTTAPGIYVLRLTANRQTRTQKMVIR